MKKFIKENICNILAVIILILVLVILFLVIFKRNKNSEAYYFALTEDLVQAMKGQEEMEKFADIGFDYKGVVAWQNSKGDVAQFKEEYASLKDEDLDNSEFKKYMAGLAYENSIDYTILDLISVSKIINKGDISICTIEVKTKSDTRYDMEETIVTFYKGKIIDVEIISNDNQIKDVYSNFTNKINVKTTGYYIDKSPEKIWYMYTFNADGTVFYDIILCPDAIEEGLGCGGSNEDKKGTYEVKNNKVMITLTDVIAPIGEDEDGWHKLDKNIKEEYNLESENVLKNDSYTFNWQEELN